MNKMIKNSHRAAKEQLQISLRVTKAQAGKRAFLQSTKCLETTKSNPVKWQPQISQRSAINQPQSSLRLDKEQTQCSKEPLQSTKYYMCFETTTQSNSSQRAATEQPQCSQRAATVQLESRFRGTKLQRKYFLFSVKNLTDD